MLRSSRKKMSAASSIFDFEVLDADHKPYNLVQHKGSPLLIYNVASKCGYTKGGYETATTLYNKYKSQGFTVLAFPCNQFGGQEPGNEEEIKEFVCTKFKAEFPIMAKINVNGENAHPLYEYMKKTKPGILATKAIKWNFTSFLIDRDGVPVERFSPGASVKDIEEKLIPLLGSARL
ncbi:glutathione peroxidase-like protein 3, putative [Trypanosoma brucei gambiense DAL972]|uniref:Glutathione peroxidase n=2 Tax=Trypanosoma brucei TaxID=5691 RepID=C9ZS00_TRYB9|nr:glutathione peroxidase-like protein 3, putative [Trypanosoma brucei gambiense DAL972]RHW71564.1 trypanothione/tryparedoxin dependent peroxidase 3 [Trypanosoma brucei equiperdum]CBH12136.1 glutathione peroxidase-like protein 3, putative [Trypanosoma brucei gambiense DAL972]|eukprot:XP_011774419.1 glutathione peroxidase-like protein 3, putative [Trypanosoma brucei gambiense DAL972]